MKKILCATRGGEASLRTQDAVIAMAKETGATVLFLYVVDVEFLKVTARGVRHDVVVTEMEHMGEFLLAMACERAAAQGVEAESCLQHGPLLQALESAACAEGVDAIAFGRPIGPDSSFSLSELEELTAKLEQDTGVKTYIL
ncbi:MAG: universal stress protein [Anaerolineae bacterium]|jgi:nucleotide-binding universal stress UspA family protein